MNCDALAGLAAIIWGVKWLNVILFLSICYGAFLLWRIHTAEDNRFSIVDMFMDADKASLTKLILGVMAALSVWTIVMLVQLEKMSEVVTLLPIVLGIFVVGRTATQIWGKTPPGDPPKEGP
jgi:hypothetical protein